MPTLRNRDERGTDSPMPSSSRAKLPAALPSDAFNPFFERENGAPLPIPTPAMKIAAYSLLEEHKNGRVREELLLGLAVEYLSFGGGATIAKYKL